MEVQHERVGRIRPREDLLRRGGGVGGVWRLRHDGGTGRAAGRTGVADQTLDGDDGHHDDRPRRGGEQLWTGTLAGGGVGLPDRRSLVVRGPPDGHRGQARDARRPGVRSAGSCQAASMHPVTANATDAPAAQDVSRSRRRMDAATAAPARTRSTTATAPPSAPALR